MVCAAISTGVASPSGVVTAMGVVEESEQSSWSTVKLRVNVDSAIGASD
jgi:hypothetical protein